MDHSRNPPLLHAEETFKIRGALFEVYRTMGCGFLEAVYQECLELEFDKRGIAFEAQKPLALAYKGQPLKQVYVADFVCYQKLVVELKALRTLAPEHRAQTINYLRASSIKLGLLVNFGAPNGVEIERFAL